MNTHKNSELTTGEIIYVTTGDQRMANIAREFCSKIAKALEHRNITSRHSFLEQVKDAVDGNRVKAMSGMQVEMDVITQEELELFTRSAGGNWEQAR